MASLHLLLAGGGTVIAGAVALHHLFHLRSDGEALHGSLAGYYSVMGPYIAVSGAVLVAFFGVALAPRRLAAALGGPAMLDAAFLGLALVWLGTARRIFAVIDEMADEYFSTGETGGG
ncbi:MAG: hypothetical protein SVU88_01770 [Candidatus Nanohaloarchaea archaeon]|nr:hypothetical protein [Candidatus Nanohaloarchaea archaeon]